MDDLFSAVYTRFNTTPYSSFYNGTSGQLYLEEAATTAEMPYAVYNMVNSNHDWTFKANGSEFEETVFDFNLFSDSTGGATEITQLYEKLKEQFDNCSMTVSGHSHLKMRRENAWLSVDSQAIPNKRIWQYTVQYRNLLHKSTT
jgi:hypothetical protein